MVNVEWRKIDYHNAHEYIGKTVRVRVDVLEGYVYSTLRLADITGFTVDAPARRDGLSYDWDEASLESPWYRADGNITLTGDPFGVRSAATHGGWTDR